ncbi:MAG: sugar transferase [Candidatus Omnitrophica bacterium]|nr:sugar transferase [Candidatus Omnitrophota bacterium]MCB9721146.1 sugar transferase [Candidatus Omnitrophota bacterium]
MASHIAERYLIRIVYITMDLFLAAMAFWSACLILPHKLKFDITLYNIFLGEANPHSTVFCLWTLVIIILNYTSGLFETRRELSEVLEVWAVLKANMLAALIVMVSIYVVKIEGFPRTIFAMSFIFIFGYLTIWRIIKRSLVDYLVSHGYNNFNVVIVGAGKVGRALTEEIHKRPGFGLRVVGYLDDFKPTDEKVDGIPILGKTMDFVKIARKEFIQKIFITIHLDERVFSKLLEEAKRIGVNVRLIPHGYHLLGGQLTQSNIGTIPVLEYSNMLTVQKQAGKRIFDVIFSLIFIMILAPFLLMVAILIKLDSPGPVFHRSLRYGRKGHKFQMLKFRSMVKDAEKKMDELRQHNEVDGPIFKIKNDPRITPIGRILRKYSIDELPQLFNVLKGDMSLVGPRPLLTEEVQREDLRQLLRLEVLPGMTGLWQIRGRSDVSFTRLLRWDMWYINNWSIWLDVNILFQTIPVVIRGRGAY